MCGIAGGIGIDRSALTAALDAIGHRGPDARGTWFSGDGGVALGHVRLSIIDLDPRSNQPMVCPRTGNVLVFNGEIYNFQGIRRELEALGWEFRTRSDTEVILAAYGQWGAGCLGRFNGMFAFAIYEPALRRFFLARDRVGKKPLYFSLRHQGLVFGSELKALLRACPGLPRELDPVALREYLDLGYIPGAATIYREARKLRPAHYAVYSIPDGTFTEYGYWLPICGEQLEIGEHEAAEELEYLLRDAVRLRLVSDVPVGVFLSGGLDSSLVSAFVAQENPDVVAYTARFPIARYDESHYAAMVARHLGLDHRIVPVNADDLATLQWLGGQLDEPFGDSSILPTYLISKAIREHVKVVLSGDGGDELFGGYDYYAIVLREGNLGGLPHWLRAAVSRCHRLIPVGCKGKNYLRRLPYDGLEKFLHLSAFPEHTPELPFKRHLAAMMAGITPDRFRQGVLDALPRGGSGASLLNRMTLTDYFSYLPDDVLVKVDRASMLASLEVRSPLLDYRIAEFAFRLPDHLRVRGKIRKYLMKRIARNHLPADYPYDRKQGFSIPVDEWFKGKWQDAITGTMGASELIDMAGVKALQRRHNASGRYGKLLFRILALSYVEKQFGITL